MNMQPLQGPSELKQSQLKQFLVNDNMQVKSSLGQRVVTAETPNKGTLTLRLKDVVAVLENQVKSAKSPEEIKRTREMFQTIKKLESGSRNPLTKLLSFMGIENYYDTKFAEIEKKIGAPLLRGERQQELSDLKASLKTVEGKLPAAQEDADEEYTFILLHNEEDQKKYKTPDKEILKELENSIQAIKAKINEKKEELDRLFPETKLIEKMVDGYMLTPEQEETAKLAAYSRYDQLANVDDDLLRLFAAKMAVNMVAGHQVTPKDEIKLDFIQSLNTIPKNIPLKKEEDLSLIEKKNIFIKNLKPDSPLRALLANEELQKLAKVMDDVMDENVSMQDFANIVGIDYPERIRAALGTEDIDDASVALILLQKNTSFLDALKNLYQYRDEHPDFSLQLIETDLAPHFTAKEMLNEVSDISSQIDVINMQLENSSLNDDVTELINKQTALYKKMENYS